MEPYPRPCPHCGEPLEAVPTHGGVLYEACPRCHGVWVAPDDLEAVLGGALPAPHAIALPNPFGAPRSDHAPCPECGTPSLAPIGVGDLDGGVAVCRRCRAYFFELHAFTAVRRMIAEGEAAERISAVGRERDDRTLRTSRPTTVLPPPPTPRVPRVEAPARVDDAGTVGSWRLAHDEPWTRLLALPLALSLGALFGLTEFGRLLATPIRIQFHELGHAIPAWLSGRFALPLPCGLTFWSPAPSLAAHVVVVLLVALLVIRGVRERRPFALVMAAAFESLHIVLGVLMPNDRAVRAILLSGCGAEMVLPAACLVAFYFRMPDRLRWDFFRLLVAPVAGISFVGSFELRLAVIGGRENAPIGSIMGTAGDGSGDLERLVAQHGLGLGAIVRGYVAVGFVALAVMVVVYTVFARAAIAELGRREGRRRR